MIEGILECLLPKISELAINLTQTNPSKSNLLFALYLITSKRTSVLGLSFFVAEVFGLTYGLWLYTDGHQIYIGSMIITAYFAKIQLDNSRSSSVAFWCLALICFYGYGAYDAIHFPKTETDFYLAYPSALLCIHVCLIVSHYDVRRICNSVGHKLYSLLDLLRSNYTIKYFCYTVSYRFKRGKQQWNQQIQ